jgi:hypothetical protein
VVRERDAFERCVRGQDTLLLRRVCDRLGTWVHLGGLEGIDEPGVRARAELTALRHLAPDPIGDGYAGLIDRCVGAS